MSRGIRYQNLYLHVPFCRRKCDYCAFYSLDHAEPEAMRAWTDKIIRELSAHASEFAMPLHSVYLGGGTPSLLPEVLLAELFSAMKQYLPLTPDTEISMEMNPETVTAEKAEAAAGLVNRVSMGVQSFHPDVLRVLGRHTGAPERVPESVKHLRAAGIRNLGMDLIYAVPGQTEQGWADDLKQAMALEPEHLSCYSLTIEEGAALARGDRSLKLPSDDISASMWEQTGTVTGLIRYEISNSSRPGYECRHNQNVWHGETYLGLGPAASSFDGSMRFTQCADLRRWLGGAEPEYDPLPPEARAREIFVMGLRTVRGWRAEEFSAAAGMSGWPADQRILDRLAAEGLLDCGTDHAAPTRKGLLFWNTLAEELI